MMVNTPCHRIAVREFASCQQSCIAEVSSSQKLHPRSRVFTTDSDFAIYRRDSRQVVPLLAPPDT